MKVVFFIPKKMVHPCKRLDPLHLKDYTEDHFDLFGIDDSNYEFYVENKILQLFFHERNHPFRGHYQIETVVNVVRLDEKMSAEEKYLKVYLRRI